MQFTKKEIEEKKNKLRDEWIKKPWKRGVILKQVKLLDKALSYKPL